MNMELSMTHEELLDNAPSYADRVAYLWIWSTNHEYPTPATLFLDIIGYSLEQHGETLIRELEPAVTHLGVMDIGYLADALNEYATRPQDVMEYIELLLQSEDA